MQIRGNKYEREARIRFFPFTTSTHPSQWQPASSATTHFTSPTTSTPPVYLCMLDELQFRRTNDNDASLPRTIYLPELDMEVVILPPAHVPPRGLPSDTVDVNSRVKYLRTSMNFGGVSFPKPSPLPKPPRYD